jgi:hypothetical protein
VQGSFKGFCLLEHSFIEFLMKPTSTGHLTSNSNSVFSILKPSLRSIGLILHYTGSELDPNNSANGTNPIAALDFPGYVHTIGNLTALDRQISYKFGQPEVVAPEAPKPGYDKGGKKIVGEKTVVPVPQGSSWGIRNLWRTLP